MIILTSDFSERYSQCITTKKYTQQKAKPLLTAQLMPCYNVTCPKHSVDFFGQAIFRYTITIR